MLEDVSKVLQLFALVGGGGFALFKYMQEQTWRRQQFATSLIKDFVAKPQNQKAMIMVDWVRPVELHPERDGKARFEMVTSELLINALRTEHLAFDESEMKVRDVFDSFFTDLAEFDAHITSGLLRAEQIAPYLNYWAKQMTGHGSMGRDDVWWQMKKYLECYDYQSVINLFYRLGYSYPARLR